MKLHNKLCYQNQYMQYKLQNLDIFNVKNAEWIVNNPGRNATTYWECAYIQGYYYCIKDKVTETWGLDYIDIVSELPAIHNWHDTTCTIQIILTAAMSAQIQIDLPDLVYAFKDLYRCQEFNYAYIYCNYLLEEHKTLLQKYNVIIYPEDNL